MTVTRPGAPLRPPDLLETREPRKPLPAWAKFVAIIVALLCAIGVGAASASRDRDGAAADRFDLRVASGGSGITSQGDRVELALSLDNPGNAVRFGPPTLFPPLYQLIDDHAPDPLPAGGAGLYLLEVRPGCDSVSDSVPPVALQLLLPVFPPSGREHVVQVPLDAESIRDAALDSCGLVDGQP